MLRDIFPLPEQPQFRAQSIQRARNICLSTKEHPNPRSSDEVLARGRKKCRLGFERTPQTRSELQVAPNGLYKGQVRKWSKVRKIKRKTVKMMKNELLPIRFCIIVDHSGVPPAPSRASARPLRLLPPLPPGPAALFKGHREKN